MDAEFHSPTNIALTNASELRALARARLLSSPAESAGATTGSGDHDLNPDASGFITTFRSAAVLIPIVARPALTVLLTERTPHLSAHAGQIAFPGGKIEASDAGPLAAALREAQEEIGLQSEWIEPLGYLDCYRTGTGFIISPVVALVQPGFELRLDDSEVAQVFEVPLGFLMDETHHRIDRRNWRGAERRFYAMPYEDYYIWGATAGMIRMLYRRLFAE